MVMGLLFLIVVNGMGFFWPQELVEFTLKDKTRVLGEVVNQETIPGSKTENHLEGQTRVQLKIGNRDLYGLDFTWVNQTKILSKDVPRDVIALERREWGNFYGRILSVLKADIPISKNSQDAWEVLLPLLEKAATIHEEIKYIEETVIGSINYDIETARLNIRSLELEGDTNSETIRDLRQTISEKEEAYQEHVGSLVRLRDQLNEYSLVMVDANGKEKTMSLGQIVKAIRPNDMSVMKKMVSYVENFWGVLTEEPREANTEGGIFPAIFGTVLMVLIMSVAVVPFGVLAAFYLREYAKQGPIVRMVRIAVNNLAGVPSIVFGVFGLGFFVYAVGGTLDNLFYPEALPNPTFGTGGILWASLTLALMTVPVVIVATEEGLSAVPREYREGSLALGATKFESMIKVILPSALPGILTGLILAVSRATGEVAPLMLTGVVKLAPSLPVDFHFPFLHLDRKFMHLGFHIYDVGFQSPNVEAAKPMVFVTTLILVLVVILLNLAAIGIRNHMRKKYRGANI